MPAYIVDTSELRFTLASDSTYPFAISANPITKDCGWVVKDGGIYKDCRRETPVFMVDGEGKAHITDVLPDLSTLSRAKFAFSGSVRLLRGVEPSEAQKPNMAILRAKARVWRVGVGIRKQGSVVFVVEHCTLNELKRAMVGLQAVDALQLSFGDIFYQDVSGGIRMADMAPISVLEAKKLGKIATPIIVLDAGHGGDDPGAVGFGLREKDITLKMALAARQFLADNYVGTFLLTRTKDETVELQDRVDMVNGIHADAVISFHLNAADSKLAHGFELYVTSRGASDTSKALAANIHTHAMHLLAPLGVVDRGLKTADFSMISLTHCPAVLTENMFISNAKEGKLALAHHKELAIAEATALAETLKLAKKPVEKPKPKPTKKPTPKVTNTYVVQAGVFTDRANAEKLVKQLEERGFSGVIKSVRKE